MCLITIGVKLEDETNDKINNFKSFYLKKKLHVLYLSNEIDDKINSTCSSNPRDKSTNFNLGL